MNYTSGDKKLTQMLLDDKVIEIKFVNPSAKKRALDKLRQSLYRQEAHTDYIYVFCQVHDDKTSSHKLTEEFANHHSFSDLVMVQCNVPMGRNAELDLIRIDNCPEEFTKDDCKTFEDYLKKDKLGMENAYDLAIRKFTDVKRRMDFLIIYVGNCRKRTYINKLLMQEGLTKVNEFNQ